MVVVGVVVVGVVVVFVIFVATVVDGIDILVLFVTASKFTRANVPLGS